MTPRLILSVGANESYYLNRALPYAESISKHSQIENHFCCLGFLPQEKDRFPNIHYSYLGYDQLRAPVNNHCVQHGEHTLAIPGDPSDVIFFTDADILMQRGFEEEELGFLSRLEPDQVIITYNAGPNDTLMDEASRLAPIIALEEIKARYYTPVGSPLCYNVGTIAARRDTWERLCELYISRFGLEMPGVFHHCARQQWFISYLLASEGFDIIPMPYTMCIHGHYAPPEGTRVVNGNKLYYGDRLVLLAHSIRWGKPNGSDF